jgi:nitroreductase
LSPWLPLEAEAGGNFKTGALSDRDPPPPFTSFSRRMFVNKAVIDFMLARKSAPIQELKGPAPSDDEIALMMRIATRVPDHGRLEPWRFILYRGAARHEIGEKLADLAERREGPLPPGRREKELERFSRAPLVIGVVSSPKENPKIPAWEMFLSAGAAAMSLVIAANALGYNTNWVTGWHADDAEGRDLLGLAPHEKVVAFIHVGTAAKEAPERSRPDPAKLFADYSGPWAVRHVL